ncbi:ATP-binding protein [Kitasatospora sp. NPDC048298]|uniref:ATP-binding protein n=1 Tax=Kitasatospora sp. NPDC048298 TaxID=3364049 RepID=UPI00370FEADA
MTGSEPVPPPPSAPPGPTTADLRYRPESARAARELVRGKLLEWGLDDLVDAAEVVMSEMVTNAAKTGCLTCMRVGVRRRSPRSVRLFVRDGSHELPVMLTADDDDECHRGLALIHELASGNWGTSVHACGKTAHADLQVTPG